MSRAPLQIEEKHMDRVVRTTWFLTFVLAALLVGALLPASSQAQSELDFWQVLAMDRTAFRMRPVALLPVTDEAGQIMLYGDRYGYLRANQVTGDGSFEIWRSPILDGAVLEVLVEDLQGDGRVEIICRTQTGRLYVFDEQFNPRWQNLREDYQEITCMALANVDEDPAYEMVILGQAGFIDYIDGADFSRQFRSTQNYQGRDMAVGNVDTDAILEIVLNSGLVLDTIRLEPKWSTEAFGEIIDLIDIDGDGILEVIGYVQYNNLRIFDVDMQLEKPVR